MEAKPTSFFLLLKLKTTTFLATKCYPERSEARTHRDPFGPLRCLSDLVHGLRPRNPQKREPMQKPKRAKSIKIRVSEEELWAMREGRGRGQVGVWLRDLALGQTKRKPVPQADPALLRQLAAIGNNLNQLAKWVNSAKPASALSCAAALVALGRELEAIRAHQDSQ